jgi:prepilin-type processing-associated H-X9-DG protein/prepilin-type N-terminal cleavage/methylation domain-containing protein
MRRRSRAAFTLVELLVVIGIIAVLIGITLTSVAAARRQANLVVCAANLRQIAHGCMLHAHDHRGYLPLAGLITIDQNIPWGPQVVAIGTSDSEQKRYTYASAPGTGVAQMIVPLPAAAAPYLLNKHLAYDNWNTLDQQLNNNRGIWQMFMCPSTDAMQRDRAGLGVNDTTVVGQGTMMSVSTGNFMSFFWSTNTDFGVNEGVFGYDYRPRYQNRRLAGNLGRIQHPSELMLFCDAKNGAKVDPSFPYSFRDPWIMIAPTLDGAQPVTLADVLSQNLANVMPYRAQIDRLRHKSRTNVVFADGHVETVLNTPGELQRVYLTAR